MKYAILILVLPLLLAGCIQNEATDNIFSQLNDNTTNEQPLDNIATYNMDEISKHNSAGDCWLLIDSKVYDVTEYIGGGKHPGGAAILEGCGSPDGTTLFSTRPMGSGTDHSAQAYSYLENFYIGNFKQ